MTPPTINLSPIETEFLLAAFIPYCETQISCLVSVLKFL